MTPPPSSPRAFDSEPPRDPPAAPKRVEPIEALKALEPAGERGAPGPAAALATPETQPAEPGAASPLPSPRQTPAWATPEHELLARELASWSSGRAHPGPQRSAELLIRVFERLDAPGAHPRGAPELANRIIDSGAFDGAPAGSLSPCPLLRLLAIAPGKPESPFNPQFSRPAPFRHNLELWGSWMIRLASRMALAPAHHDALFDALLALPHPKPLREALELGLARLPEPEAASSRFDQALAALRSLQSASNREEAAVAQAFVHACDQWSSLKIAPSPCPPEAAAANLRSASLYGFGRLAVNAILAQARQAGALSDELLSECARLSFSSQPAAACQSPGRALGALLAAPDWTPQARHDCAFSLCQEACQRRLAPLFSIAASHCEWSGLAPAVRSAFSPTFLARAEQEALRSKRVTGLPNLGASPRPAPRRARL